MKIIVDANIFTRRHKTGVDYYMENLLQAAAKAMPSDEFVFSHFGSAPLNIEKLSKNITDKKQWWLPGKTYGLLRHYLPFVPYNLVAWGKPDVYFYPDFGCPPTIGKQPKIAVVHDLTYKVHPEYVLPGHVEFLKKLVAQTVHEADQIVVTSQATADDLLREYGYAEAQTHVVPPAVELREFKPQTPDAMDRVTTKFNIKDQFILFVGTLEPRKNVPGIMEAYSLLPKELQATHQLVLAGNKGFLDADIDAWATKLGDRVIRTGPIDQADKTALYSGASVFMFPSFYEGFGIPILEAMAVGCPVITSNISSMPEVAGGAAELVDPYDAKVISAAIKELLTNPGHVKKLREAGFKRAKDYTWEESGKKLAELFRSAANS